MKIGRITDAVKVIENWGSDKGWILFKTASGDIYLASGVQIPEAVEYGIAWMARLRNEFSEESGSFSGIDAEYCDHSLCGPAGRQIHTFELAETGTSPYIVAAFIAYPVLQELIAMEGTAEAEIPKTPGLAVFEAERGSVRLLAWTLAEDAVFKGESWAFKSVEKLSGGTYRLTLPDGRNLTAEVTLPEKKTSAMYYITRL